jgi:hypothetical protein
MDNQTKRRLTAPGHKLTMEWSGEYGQESSSTGFCSCGWQESASSQTEVRNEYRFHLCDVTGYRWNPIAGLYVKDTNTAENAS